VKKEASDQLTDQATDRATMGNDGGVIAVKRKFMRHGNTKARGEKLDQEARREQRARTCAVSSEPLASPVVACALGNLYNKQALLERLLAKTLPARFAHISSLKDVVTCRFSAQGSGSYCPVTMLEFNGKHPFVVLPGCGCVLSERAMKEVQTNECLVCGAPIADGVEPILLLQPEEQYEDKQRAILARKAEEKLAKKEKRLKKKHDAAQDGDAANAGAGVGEGEQHHHHHHHTEDSDKTKQKKQKKKDRKRAAEEQHPFDAGVNAPSAKIVKSASDAILKTKETSKVFASLFSGEKSEKKSANDLLMTIGGLRYTLS
jgi:hypothetical protein